MKKIICVFILLCVFGSSIFSQEAEKFCTGTPLECAVSLLKAEDKLWYRDSELTQISSNYWELGKKREAVQLTELFDENDGEEKLNLLVGFAENSLKEGNVNEAAGLLIKAFEYKEDFEDLDEYSLKKFAFTLVAAGQEEKIGDFLNSLDDEYEKVLSLLEISKAFWQNGNYLKTIEMLSEAGKYAELVDSEYRKNRARAETGRQYIEIGELKNGFELIDLVRSQDITDSEVFDSVFAAYLKAGEYGKALEIVNEYPKFTESEIAYYSAEVYFRNGNKQESLNLLKQTANYEKEIAGDRLKDYKYWFLINVVRLYLKWNEPALALEMTKMIGRDEVQQNSFIEISQYFQKSGKSGDSSKIIESAFESAKKIKQNNDNPGGMTRDDYLANLVDECINIDNFVLAEKIVRSIEKKYYRGGGLAALVFKNKNYSPKKIWSMLDEANGLFQKNNSNHNPQNKIRLWSMLAHEYARNGQKARAQAIFAEILSQIGNDKTISDKGLIEHFVTAGYWLEKCGLTVDENIEKSMQKVATRWLADNPPEEN